jgi:O-antigen ligase
MICMTDKTRPLMSRVLTVGLFLVGAASLAMPRGYSIGFYFICLPAMLMWWRSRGSLLHKRMGWFAWPLLAYAVGNIVLGLYEHIAWRALDPYIPFCLILFGVWALQNYKPKAEWFWAGLATGAIVAAGISGFQAIKLGARADGFIHPIQFGNVALLLGTLCMVRALLTLNFSWSNGFMWLGFTAGVVASVWSQTRGGWLAIVLILSWILINATKAWPIPKRVAVAMVLAIGLGIPALQPNGVVQSRVQEAVREFKEYVDTGTQATSVGARLAMWGVAVQQIRQAPLLGIGQSGWFEVRDEAIAKRQLDPFMKVLTHVHNEYLDITLKHGIIGLGLLLMLYLVPMLVFFKPYLHNSNVEVSSLAMAGMVVPMMFMDFGLTQTFLSHNSGRMVLVSVWMCVGALLINAVEDDAERDAT